MTVKVYKWNKYGMHQERNFVITNYCIYNFKKKDLRRVILIENMIGITKNMGNASTEFVIHVGNEPDYRLSCDK